MFPAQATPPGLRERDIMAGVRGRISGALRRVSGTASQPASPKPPATKVAAAKKVAAKKVAAKAPAKKVAAKAPAKKVAARAPVTKVAAKAPAKKVAAKAPAKKVAAKKVAAKAVAAKAPAKKVAAKKVAAKAPVTKVAAKAPAKKAASKAPASKAPATRAPAAKNGVGGGAARPTADLTAGELREIRARLQAEFSEMQAEYDKSLIQLNDLQTANTDGAGDDQADVGSKTFEREQEQSIAANRHDLLIQIEHAFERMDAGTYGICENCGKPIPKARLKALPMATLDAECKAREERH